MNGCNRCPRGCKTPCDEPRHSCQGCNGVGIVRNRDTFIACTCSQEKTFPMSLTVAPDKRRVVPRKRTGQKTRKQ